MADSFWDIPPAAGKHGRVYLSPPSGTPAVQTTMASASEVASVSIWGESTDTYKQQTRAYLNKLLADHSNEERFQLTAKLQWCYDRWDYWRQRFFSETESPLLFPFFKSGRLGKEFGHYSRMGDTAEPSVIHIQRRILMGGSDVRIASGIDLEGYTYELLLSGEHPMRYLFCDQVILHELVHQYLHEAAPAAVRMQYAQENKNYKGHGGLFAAECNRINKVLHPEMKMAFVPVRHGKTSHAPPSDRQRPSCGQFGFLETFFAWQPPATKDKDPLPLNPEQREENEQRLTAGLEFFEGAVVKKRVPPKTISDFLAPYSIDCANKCFSALEDHDRLYQGQLKEQFIQAVLDHLKATNHPAAIVNIPPVEGMNGNGRHQAIPESGPTVPVKSATPEPAPAVSVLEDKQTLGARYPVTDPERSLKRMDREANLHGGMAKLAFAVFGHPNGQQLSRHKKRLTDALAAVAA